MYRNPAIAISAGAALSACVSEQTYQTEVKKADTSATPASCSTWMATSAREHALAAVNGAKREPERRASPSFVRIVLSAFATVVLIAVAPAPAVAQGHPELEASARAALSRLKATVPLAETLEKRAVAVLVFPEVTKAGFLIGGEYGNGMLLRRGRFAGHYNTAGVSYGMQAGAETFGYAMFFMNEGALRALDAAAGFEIGVGPSVVVLDQGEAKSITSTTLTSDVYAFIFGQTGLMAGVGLQGTKITKLSR